MSNMRVRAEVDLDAIQFNMDSMHKNLKNGTLMTAVVKTDGYGHGAVEIAKKLQHLYYLWGYAVATYEEAEEIRAAGITKPILILGYVFPEDYPGLVKDGIRPAVFREDMLEQLNEAAAARGVKLKIHLAVDTGMSRIGVRPDDSGLEFVKKAMSCKNLDIEGMFTHFAKADMAEGAEATRLQYERFTHFEERIRTELGLNIPLVHCSNSAALITYRDMNLDMVRAGITLYGLWPSNEVDRTIVPLKPALSLKSHIAFVKSLEPGESVSYGGTFTAKTRMRVATIPVGYGDGYPRSLSNKGYVLIRGQKAPILGRVCMDQFMVDVDAIPDACEGDEVTLLGRDGEQVITAEELGDLSGRFNYELCCDLSRRVPRVYLGAAGQ